MPVFSAPSLNELAAGRPKPGAVKLDAIGRRVYRANEEPRKAMGPQIPPAVRDVLGKLRGTGAVRPQENDTNALRALIARRSRAPITGAGGGL